MSVYEKETANNLTVSLESILNQSVKKFELILIVDGFIGNELTNVIDVEKKKFADANILFRTFQLDNSGGLVKALNFGLSKIKNKYVARMDSDDYCCPNRFEIQLNYMKSHPDVVLIGSNVQEFESDPRDTNEEKRMPITNKEIVKYSKLRNPFCHPTVFFKREVINKLGNYENYELFEDYYLWIKVINAGFKCANINLNLVSMRTGNGLYVRRGGRGYINKVFKFRRQVLKIGYINIGQFLFSIMVSVFVSVISTKLRKKVYNKFLRKSS